MRSLIIIAAFPALLSAVSASAVADTGPQPDSYTVDLHCHPFMEDGMGAAFKGKFDNALVAKDYTALFDSEINADALDRSGDGIVVVTLYAHPVLAHPPREAIRKQLAMTHRFLESHPNWALATGPDEARQSLAAGKRVLVLGLERASHVLDNEKDLEEFIDRGGIRIVTFLHLDDDHNGGVALMDGVKSVFSPWAWLGSLFAPQYEVMEGVKINAHGLTDTGRRNLAALLKRHVWIDLSHSSEKSQRDAIPMILDAGQPLLYTHVPPQRFLGYERGISDLHLAEVAGSHGIVGVLPAEDMLKGTPINPAYCPKGCVCKGSVAAFASQYADLVAQLDAESVMLGSDFNGGIEHLKPACGTRTELDHAQGLWNMGQTAALWQAVENVGAPVPKRRAVMVDGFLKAWDRVYSPGN